MVKGNLSKSDFRGAGIVRNDFEGLGEDFAGSGCSLVVILKLWF